MGLYWISCDSRFLKFSRLLLIIFGKEFNFFHNTWIYLFLSAITFILLFICRVYYIFYIQGENLIAQVANNFPKQIFNNFWERVQFALFIFIFIRWRGKSDAQITK